MQNGQQTHAPPSPGPGQVTLQSLDASILITGANLLYNTVQGQLLGDKHLITALVFLAAYILLGMLQLMQGYKGFLRVAHRISELCMTQGLMSYVTMSLQNASSSASSQIYHGSSLIPPPIVTGTALVLGFGLLQLVAPVQGIFTGMQYAYSDMLHQTALFQNRPTRGVLALTLLMLLASQSNGTDSSLHYSLLFTIRTRVVRPVLALVTISYFVVHILVPPQVGSIVDDLVTALSAVWVAHAAQRIQEWQMLSTVQPYVISKTASRISQTISGTAAAGGGYRIQPSWVSIVYVGVLTMAAVAVVRRASGGDKCDVMQNPIVGILVMVTVNQILSEITVVDVMGSDDVPFTQYFDAIFLSMAGIAVVQQLVWWWQR